MKFLSNRIHTFLGVVVGAVLLAAPYIFGFSDEGTAATIPWVVGAVILVNEFIADADLSIFKIVPMQTHRIIDALIGVFLALSPVLFDFTDLDASAWVPHVIVGLLIVGYAMATRVSSPNTMSHA